MEIYLITLSMTAVVIGGHVRSPLFKISFFLKNLLCFKFGRIKANEMKYDLQGNFYVMEKFCVMTELVEFPQ